MPPQSPVPTLPPTAPATRLHRMGGFIWAHKAMILAGLVMLGLGLWQGRLLLIGPQLATDKARRVRLIETVVATGTVQSPFRATIGSQITGTVAEVAVDEGAVVAQGQVLVTLADNELAGAVVQARGAVAEAQAHIREMSELTLPTAQASLRQTQATLLNAQQTYNRAAELIRKGDETRVVLDAAKRDLDVAQTQVRTAEVQVFTASAGGSAFVTARTQLDQAQATLVTATSRLGYATITAPRAGILISRNVERGSVVQPGMALMMLAPAGQTQLVLSIDERNLARLVLGQTAIASADAYPGEHFAAVLSFINPGIDIARASVEVKLTVTAPPPYLRQDMTVSVDIEVGRSENALVVPARAVHEALSSAPWVMAVRDGRAVRLPVRIGVQGTTQFEILHGLAEGENVLAATSPVAAGQRVRALQP